jgi:hypothetical protein
VDVGPAASGEGVMGGWRGSGFMPIKG